MNRAIENLKPEQIWRNFKYLTQIPRPSKKEMRVIAFMKDFGEKLGLETQVDPVGNILIRKPATKGMENRLGVVFQSHLDMVPQKNSDKQHDFENDPIEAYIDGEWVKANGTTLGADNGIGAATMMALLESNDIEHGPLEALFTVDEETGMTGAFALKPGQVKGEILLNLDSEDEGELYIGCAGGMDANISFDLLSETVPGRHLAFLIRVYGLKGGHSGLDIHLGRGNSNLIIARLLNILGQQAGLRICEIEGGNMRNAIPREAHARVVVPEGMKEAFLQASEQMISVIKKELTWADPDLKIEISSTDRPDRVMAADFQKRLLAAILACPNGVMRMADGIPGLVETSNNLAIVKTSTDKVQISCLLRSSVDSAKTALSEIIQGLFELAGAGVSFAGSYPGWKPNMQSAIMKTMQEVYLKKFGNEPEIKAVHAGLECGIIGGVYPNLDMISLGPTIRHPHSPDEKVHIESVSKFWDFVLEVLKNIPTK